MKNNKEKKVDEIMKKALASDVEPENVLNQSILQQWKESPDMNKKRRIPFTLAAAMCVLLLSVSVGAAVKYLKPSEIADQTHMNGVAEAFKGKDAIEINESQDAGNYRITLLGITKGEALINSELSKTMPNLKSTYAAVAVERLDGKAMPSLNDKKNTQSSFFISPLIEGLEPWQYNIATMNGGYSDMVVNGIFYRIIECNDIEKFADRNLYLCVSDTDFLDKKVYAYDEATGAISRKKDYKGINLLFDLPIDAAKADRTAAKKYLKNLEKSWKDSADEDQDHSRQDLEDQVNSLEAALKKGIKSGNIEKALKNAVLDEKSRKTMTIKGDHYEYNLDTDGGLSGESLNFYKDNFVNGMDYMVCYTDYNEKTQKFEALSITVIKENGDGTAEGVTYKETF